MMVFDTCGLLVWTHQPERLKKATADAIAEIESVGSGAIVCSATFFEIALKCAAKQLDLGMAPDEYLGRVRRMPVRIESVDAALWLESVALDWTHRDPIDRLVVALARRHEASVVTSDGKIHAWYKNTVW